MKVALKRAYEEPSKSDGTRVLVDRLWPRGITKETAKITAWLKDLAPSNELRQWYHARPTQWAMFRKKYLAELRSPEGTAALEELYKLAAKRARVTLIYASKNTERNNATVLKELLEGGRKPPVSTGPVSAAAMGRKRARARG
jgi:uncharacterized protein YeaO (DUF488 family)